MIAPAPPSSSCRPCATPRRRRGASRTSCSSAAASSARSAPGSGRSCRSAGACTEKIEQIIREEMDAIGAQEMFVPVLTPAELWQQVGPLRHPGALQAPGPQRSRLRPPDDARGDVHLPRASSSRATGSCRRSWYHFQTKDRDEPRPRGGLLRVREFIMKDSYSFDRDEAGLDVSFQRARAAPTSGSSSAAGSRRYGVAGGVRDDGRQASRSTTSRRPARGENTLVTCENGDYAADLEIARGVPRAPEFPERARRARGGRDAGHAHDRGARRAARDRSRRRRRRRCRS